MTTLVVTNLYKSFDDQPVLRDVELTVPDGSLTAVLGPSGSGKTTLLRIIAGFERADHGTVVLDDKVVDDSEGRYVHTEQRHIGYVPQEGSLFPHLTVEKNVGFGLSRDARRNSRVDELLELVGLANLGKRYPHQLSGGQQQRVALARALATKPQMVLLDEPFSSLDAGLRASVRADVQQVLHHAGTTALLVTHDQDEALSIADHVAVIFDGRIGQVDTPQRLYTHPAEPRLARFLGDINLVPGVMDHGSVKTVLGVLPLYPSAMSAGSGAASGTGAASGMGTAAEVGADGSHAVVMIRPEQIELISESNRNSEHLAGRVLEYQYYGHDAVVRVQLDNGGSDGGGSRPGTSQCETLIVRVTGGRTWTAGARVGVVAHGPVLTWPEGSSPEATAHR